MSTELLKGPGIKAAAIVLLVGTAVFVSNIPLGGHGHTDLPMIICLLLFGVINVLMAVPGTAGIRIVAIVLALFTMLWSRYLGVITTVAALIVWPAWMIVAWAVNLAQAVNDDAEGEPAKPGIRSRIAAAALVGATAVGAVAYQWIRYHRLEQTSALFIGTPALLSLLVVFLPSPRSAAGVACKVVTIGLLMSMMFLWEGALCVVMSAPLFYAVAVAIGGTVDYARRNGARSSTISGLLLVVLAPMSLEGVTKTTSFNRDESVTETRRVQASSSDVGRAILSPPRFDRQLPLYLRAGFPRATGIRIESTAAGTQWLVTVTGGEMKLNGMEARQGTLVLQVEESRPGLMQWRVVSDGSHMTHFLRWREAKVEWRPVAEGVTEVTWSLRYERGLDPAWYFGPWERYAARLGAGYLIDSVATP